MADEITKEVLLRVKLDPSQLEKNGAQLEKSLQGVKDQIVGVNKALKDKNIGAPERDKLLDQLRQLQKEQNEWKKQISANNKEIEFQLKLTNAQEGSNEQLRLQLSSLTKVYNGLSKEARENSAEGNQLKETIKGLSDTLKDNESAVGDNRRNVGNYKQSLEEVLAPLLKQKQALQAQTETLKQNVQSQDQAIKKTFGFGAGIKTFNASLGETESSFEAVNKQIIANEQSIASLDQEIQKVSIGFVNADGSIKGITQTSKVYENTLDGLQQKLVDLKQLAPTLDLNSDEFKSTNEEIRNTTFEIDKAIGKVDEFGNKEPKNPAKKGFEDTFEAASALTSSIGLLSIAFGKNESIQVIQEKTLKAVAIAQTLANIAKSKGAIEDTVASIKTSILTAKQALYTIVVGSSTGALKAFRIALATTGVGLLILGIGLLVTKMGLLDSILGKDIKDTKALTDSTSQLNAGTKKASEFVGQEITQLVSLFAALRNTTAQNKDRQKLINEINGKYGTTLKNLKDEAAFADSVSAAYEQLKNKIIAVAKAKAATESITEFASTLIDLEFELANVNLSIEKFGEKNKELIKINDDLVNQSTKNIDELNTDVLAQQNVENLQNNTIDIQEQITKRDALTTKIQEINNRIGNLIGFVVKPEDADKSKKATKAAEDNLKAILDFEKKVLNDKEDLQNETLADQEKKEQENLKISIARQKSALEEEFKNLKAITTKEKEEKEKAQIILNDRLQQLTEDELSKQLDINQKFRDIEEAARNEEAQKKFERQIIDLNKSKESRRLDIEETIKDERTKSIALIQLEIDTQKELINIAEKSANVDKFITPDEKDKIDEAKLKLRELEIQLKQINKNPLQIIPKDFADKFKEVADIISSVLTNLANGVNAAFQSATANLEAQSQAQQKAILKSTLTEKQKAKQIDKLNEETAKKKYKLDLDAFKFNQGVQIGQAIISGAEALIANFAVPDPSLGIVSGIRAAIIAATTATNIAIIASQQPPPPPFYEGGYTGDGDPRSESNSKGPRPYIYHKGEYIVPNKILKTPQGEAMVNYLEKMRIGKLSSLGLSGFADGGFTANESRSGVRESIAISQLAGQISDALAKVQIITRVTDINRINKNLIQNKAAATLR